MKESQRKGSGITADTDHLSESGGAAMSKMASGSHVALACKGALSRYGDFLGKFYVLWGNDLFGNRVVICHCHDGRDYEVTIHESLLGKENLSDIVIDAISEEVEGAIMRSGLTRLEMFMRYGKAAISE
jgi:hypothetical protein